jgi:hypothetical protein
MAMIAYSMARITNTTVTDRSVSLRLTGSIWAQLHHPKANRQVGININSKLIDKGIPELTYRQSNEKTTVTAKGRYTAV